MGRKERRSEQSQNPQTATNGDSSVQAWLAAAMSHHQAGQLNEAETLYRQILERDPHNIDSLHLLGLISFQRGDPDTAITLIGKAIAKNDKVAALHYNIANAYISTGKASEAQKHYERALALEPAYAEAANNLGYVLLKQNEPEKAAAYFNKALKINPNYAEAHNNLGLVLKDLGKMEEALASFEKALTLKPDYLFARNNLALTLRNLERPDEALKHYEQVLTQRPDYVEARNNLANALRDLGRLSEAKQQLECAIALKPDYAEAHSNLGNVYKDLGKHEEAIKHYERATVLKPDFATAYYNIGTIHQEAGRHKEAMEFYNVTLALDKNYGDALWNQSLLYLLNGDFEKGWKQYERRWLKKEIGNHGFTAPLWDGKILDGKTILLHCEQGLGDSLQFVRYVPMVSEFGGRVILYCPPALARIFRSVHGVDLIVPEGQPVPEHDCRAPLMSLPLIFNTTLETIPADVPYLKAPDDQILRWEEKLKPFKGLKVGLLWAGNPRKFHADSYAVDRRRSMSLDQFAPLAGIPNVHYFSLQKGEPEVQLKNPPSGLNIINFMNEIQDFADTAALIENLDLVIGVDTSVIHMAGALAKPTWVLSRFDGCWRWLLDRDDSPWYPTLRLFRQTQAGDWESVVEKVRGELLAKALDYSVNS